MATLRISTIFFLSCQLSLLFSAFAKTSSTTCSLSLCQLIFYWHHLPRYGNSCPGIPCKCIHLPPSFATSLSRSHECKRWEDKANYVASDKAVRTPSHCPLRSLALFSAGVISCSLRSTRTVHSLSRDQILNAQPEHIKIVSSFCLAN